MIDLRSDTVTRPTEAMRAAMAGAEVGDDVYGEDPTVRVLEERVAGLFGHEAALFMPTGSMANVLAVAAVVRPGQEVLCEARAHIARAELGAHGIRVNGVNPDGVVRGSGIFAKGWGADRARTYGVPEDKLGEFYAQRTILKREVLPEHVAAAVFALVGGDLSLTTGLHIPVDSGVAAAFLR